MEKHPNYLVAIDYKRDRIFVLAPPSLSALKINGKWNYAQPLPEEEIPEYVLVTDTNQALSIIQEAKKALEEKIN